MYDFANYRDDIIILILVFFCMALLWYLSKNYELKILKKIEKNKVAKIIEPARNATHSVAGGPARNATHNVAGGPARNATHNVAGGEERLDDLTLIEGIGPKIKELLYSNNIKSFEKLSRTNTLYLQNMLDEAGNSFNMANPKTWPEQARLAHESRWEELDEYQNELYGGL
jgi:predicted flap endonuclease-1-like 5' DNA nuclease